MEEGDDMVIILSVTHLVMDDGAGPNLGGLEYQFVVSDAV